MNVEDRNFSSADHERLMPTPEQSVAAFALVARRLGERPGELLDADFLLRGVD